MQLDPELKVATALTHYSSELFDVTGSGFSFDLAFFLDLDRLQISVANRNVLPMSVSYSNGATEKIPNLFTTGLKVQASKEWILFTHLQSINGKDQFLSYGLQYVPVFLNGVLSVSTGYRQYDALGDFKERVSLGLGLNLGVLSLQFAYVPNDYLLQSNQYCISTHFNL